MSHEIQKACAVSMTEGKTVRIPSNLPAPQLPTSHFEELDGQSVVTVGSGPRKTAWLTAKRSLDVVGATLGLIVSQSAVRCRGSRDPPLRRPADPLPPGAGGIAGSRLRRREIPDHDSGRRRPTCRPSPVQRGQRQCVVQDDERPPGHVDGPLLATVEHRRVAPALECPPRRDEPRRPTTAPARRRGRVCPLAPSAVGR